LLLTGSLPAAAWASGTIAGWPGGVAAGACAATAGGTALALVWSTSCWNIGCKAGIGWKSPCRSLRYFACSAIRPGIRLRMLPVFGSAYFQT
jgi:hypothetical protein